MNLKYPEAGIFRAMLEYFGEDDRRIDHALRVLVQAERLMEEDERCDAQIVIASALLHDVGIKVSEEKHGYNTGKTQEEYGPPVAEELLGSIGFPREKIGTVKDIIGNHHSRSLYDYPELEVLNKADRIVNRDEDLR